MIKKNKKEPWDRTGEVVDCERAYKDTVMHHPVSPFRKEGLHPPIAESVPSRKPLVSALSGYGDCLG